MVGDPRMDLEAEEGKEEKEEEDASVGIARV